MTLEPGSQLGRYEIVSRLGQGGMGVVYEARDPRLKRTVAIKLLPPDLTRDDTAKQRLVQEAQAASALDHPNICTIHEINETDDGQLYLVMAHYEGETLRERIARGPLGLKGAIDIATQVGQGLAEAHGAGIVHRDIKPANVFVTKGGTVKVLDFGVAKLVGREGVTQTGTTVGTVAYMSPEQARGLEVDHRTDIWSLGVVLYEMLTGAPPFQGENLLSLSNAITDAEPAWLSRSSSAVQSVVSRALSKDRTARYVAVDQLVQELRRLVSRPDASTVVAPAPPQVPSIAVLPFDDMSPPRDQNYFCEGMAEEIINALAGLDGLRVAARTSSFQCKEQKMSLAEIGRELGVGAVLEGSVRKAGQRLRVTAQLINLSDGFHVWSERYDRDMDDVFAVQDEIARAVVDKLKVKLLGVADDSLVKRATDNLEAYNLVLEGRYHRMRMTRPALEKSLECFTQALALEPSYAQAHAGVAMVHVMRAVFSVVRPHAVMPMAKEAALRGLGIDETVAEAHTALAMVRHFYEWEWAGAERAYRRGLELNPGDTEARGQYAALLGALDRTDQAIAEAEHAVERDPLSAFGRFEVSYASLLARRFDRAAAEARAGIELNPSYLMLHLDLGWALAGLGRYDEAVEALRKAATVAPDDPLSQGYLGWALGLAGHTEEALAILGELEQRRNTQYVGGWLMAHVSLGLGDSNQTIVWLEKATEEHDGILPFLNIWYVFDPLRSDSRFQALLRRMSFPQPAER